MHIVANYNSQLFFFIWLSASSQSDSKPRSNMLNVFPISYMMHLSTAQKSLPVMLNIMPIP